MRQPSALALLMLGLALGPAARARAYELHTTPDGEPTHWTKGRVVFWMSPEARARLGSDALSRAMVMATEAWRGLPGSPDLIAGTGGGAGLLEPSATDGVNGVYVSDAPLGGDHLAETRLTFEPRTGIIVDADIVLSGVAPWALLDESTQDHEVYDLGAVLTHELGHALGLADEWTMNQVTMFPRFSRGDTRARTPEVDDERGVLAAYRAHPAGVSASGGCSVSGDASGTGAVALALLLIAASRRRRRPWAGVHR